MGEHSDDQPYKGPAFDDEMMRAIESLKRKGVASKAAKGKIDGNGAVSPDSE